MIYLVVLENCVSPTINQYLAPNGTSTENGARKATYIVNLTAGHVCIILLFMFLFIESFIRLQ